jgi:PilZ domain
MSIARVHWKDVMDDHRRVKRTQMQKAGKIITAAAPAIDCVVCDLTNSGAGLRISPGVSVPDCFDLIFDSRLFSRTCQVRWKHKDRLGVEFTAAQ